MDAVRDRMAESAMVLLARDGYASLSFTGVIAHAGAPRGSIYHHFPGGKDELVEAAIAVTLAGAVAGIQGLRGRPVADVVAAFAAQWRRILIASDGESGCAIMAVSAGAGGNTRLRVAAAGAFERWTAELALVLHGAGVAAAPAEAMARYLLASYEGALLLARSSRSVARFDEMDAIVRESALRLAGATGPRSTGL